MTRTRRDLLRIGAWLAASVASGTAGRLARAAAAAPESTPTFENISAPEAPTPFKRIAVEESFTTCEVFGGFLTLLSERPETEPGFAHFFETALGTPGRRRARPACPGRSTVAPG